MTEASASRPFVSVIIPTYRDWDRLQACLDALSCQTYPPESFEVVVVNNEPDSRCPFKPPGGNVLVITESRRGSYAARNAGISRSRGEILAFTDSDCIPKPDWIEQAIAVFLDHPAIHRLAGDIDLFVTGPVTPSALYERVFAFQQERLAATGTSVTANMFSRRGVFEAVGVFDAGMESGDDTEWGRRARAAGYPLQYAPTASVRHPARTRFSDLTEKSRRIYRGRYMINRWHTKSLPTRLALSLLALRPPVHAMRTLLRNRDLTPREKGTVLVVLMRLRLHQWLEHIKVSLDGLETAGPIPLSDHPSRPVGRSATPRDGS